MSFFRSSKNSKDEEDDMVVSFIEKDIPPPEDGYLLNRVIFRIRDVMCFVFPFCRKCTQQQKRNVDLYLNENLEDEDETNRNKIIIQFNGFEDRQEEMIQIHSQEEEDKNRHEKRKKRFFNLAQTMRSIQHHEGSDLSSSSSEFSGEMSHHDDDEVEEEEEDEKKYQDKLLEEFRNLDGKYEKGVETKIVEY